MRWVRLGVLALVAAMLAAVWVQDFSGALPMGLFNEGRESFQRLALFCLIALGAALAVLAVEALSGRGRRLAGAIRGGVFFLAFLELLLFPLDRLFVSGSATSPLGGPYTEQRNSRGEWAFLKKAHPGSPFGFRTDTPYAPRPAHPRVLFLGDSYTEGSGRSSACNYPDVVTAGLRARGLDVEGMNAGVAGYGPRDARALLQLLRDRGFRFGAVVYSLFLENDFTDDLPGTERRVVAGMNQRFPSAAWLRWLHPLDSTAFRWALFAVKVGTLSRGEAAAVALELGPCDLSPATLDRVDPALAELVERRLEASAQVARSPAASGYALDTVEGLRADARAAGAPFVLVVFPDRALADAALRERMGIDPGRLAPLRELHDLVLERFPGPIIDLLPALSARPGVYRPEDTHLSDLGNVVAGRAVAARLAELLPELGFPAGS